MESSREKYEWLRRLDAICDLLCGAIGTGATSLAELDIPGLLQQVPDYHKSVAQMIPPSVIDAVVKPKNAQAFKTHLVALKQYLSDIFEKLDNGEPLVYTYFVTTPEIFWGMDLASICYELIPIYLSAALTDGVEEEIDYIEQKGYPNHLCSAQKSTTGAFLLGKMPPPSCFVKQSAPCDPSNMLFQYSSREYNAPLVVVDSPYYSNERAFKYYVDEWKRMVEKLEKITGHTLDEDRLRKHVEWGNKGMEYLYGLQRLRKLVPNPDPGMHRVADTGALVLMGCNPLMTEYLKTCYEEAKERADQGKGVIPEGKQEIRTLYTWAWNSFDLALYDWLEDEFGATYLECGLTILPEEIGGYVDTSSVDSMIEGLAWRSFSFPMARQSFSFSDIWVNDFVKVAKEYKADAAVFSGHMACKHGWATNKLLSDALQEEAGIPTLRYESDIMDKRFTPPSEVRRQLTEFFRTFE